MLLSNKKLRTGCTQNQISTDSTPLSSSFNPINHTTVNVTVLASSVLPQTNLSLRPEQQMLDSKTEPPDNNHLTVDDSNEDHEIVELDFAELLAGHLHVCEICGKDFKRDANLRMHMRAHGNKFKTPEALAKSLNYGSIHRSSRRFSCLFEDDDDGQHHEEIDSSFTHNYRIKSDDIVPSYDFELIRSLPDFSPNLVSSFEREFLSELVVRVTQSLSSSESAVIHGLKCLSPLLINSHSIHWANVSLLFNVLLVFITDSRYKVREQSQLFLRDVLISFQKSSLLASASEGVQIILDRFLLLAGGATATANAGKETTGAKQVLYILDALKECFPLFSLTYKTSILKQFNSFLVLHQPLVIKHITNCLNFLFLNPESEVSPEALLEVLCSLSTLSTSSNMMPGDGITFNARLLDAGIEKVFSLIRQMCVISVFNDFKDFFASEHEEVIFSAADAPEKTLAEVNTYLSKPSEYTTSMRKAGDAQARDNLERVLDCLDRDKRETFEDCVTWARLKFENYFAQNEFVDEVLSSFYLMRKEVFQSNGVLSIENIHEEVGIVVIHGGCPKKSHADFLTKCLIPTRRSFVNMHMKPDTETYNWVVEVYTRADSYDRVQDVAELLGMMVEVHKLIQLPSKLHQIIAQLGDNLQTLLFSANMIKLGHVPRIHPYHHFVNLAAVGYRTFSPAVAALYVTEASHAFSCSKFTFFKQWDPGVY